MKKGASAPFSCLGMDGPHEKSKPHTKNSSGPPKHKPMPSYAFKRPHQDRYQPHQPQAHSEQSNQLKPVATRCHHHAHEEFKTHVPKWNCHTAIAAFATQHNPPNNRKIVVPRKRMLARRAMRSGPVNAKEPPLFSLYRTNRNPVHHDIQKRANARAQQKALKAPEPSRKKRVIQQIVQVAGLL